MQFITYKNVITFLGYLVAVELAIGTGQIKVTANMLPASWIPIIQDWAAALAILGGMAIGIVSRSLPDVTATPAAPKAQNATPGVAGAAALALAIGLMLLMSGGNASAQIKRPQITGNVAADIKANSIGGAAASTPSATPSPCDFNLFTKLDPTTAVNQIKNCVSTGINDVVSPFALDVKGALDSATASNDKVGMSCLTPGYAIVQAAAGSPAVPALPATDTAPAVAAVPAKIPGLVTIFQKYREFTLAGGPTACVSWVKTTIAASAVTP